MGLCFRKHKTLLLLSLLNFAAASVGGAADIRFDQSASVRVDFLKDFNSLWKEVENNNLVESFIFPNYIQKFVEILSLQSELDKWPPDSRLFDGINNEDCKGHILEWVHRLKLTNGSNLLGDDDKWALHMVDSYGRLPEGILSGHVNSFGDYWECLNIKVRDLKILNTRYPHISKSFAGRQCTTFVGGYDSALIGLGIAPPANPATSSSSPSAFHGRELETRKAVSIEDFFKWLYIGGGSAAMLGLPSFSTCMPNSCSQGDIHRYFFNAFNYSYSFLSLNPKNMVFPMVAFCTEKEQPDFTAADISVITLVSVILAVCLAAGIMDYWETHVGDRSPQRGVAMKYFMAFSVYTNTRKWLSTRKSAEDFGCLHGIRFISMCWVILGHTYLVYTMVPVWNSFDVKRIHEDWSLMPVLNGTFSVDTFFVMSGMLATFSLLKMMDKTKGRLNLFMFYFHRFLRLTPTYAILIGIMATVVIYASHGPYWTIMMENQIQRCKDNWWINLLYINNLYRSDMMCHGESWYLANDMQFYVVAPLIVYPLWMWEIPGLLLLSLYTILSCVAPVLVLKYNANLFPAALMSRMDAEAAVAFTEIYMRPWCRIQTFLVGIWLGWVLHKLKGRKIRIPAILVIAGWLLAAALALTVIYSIRRWFDAFYEIPETPGYFYAALSRLAWALSVAWVIFACIKGYGGIINTVLSWKVFMPLGRLTFCAYLISFYLQLIYHMRTSQPVRYDTYNVVNIFFAHLFVSLVAGYICTILFESPFIILQKYIFEGTGGTPSKSQLRTHGSKRGRHKRFGMFYHDPTKRETVIDTHMPEENDKKD